MSTPEEPLEAKPPRRVIRVRIERDAETDDTSAEPKAKRSRDLGMVHLAESLGTRMATRSAKAVSKSVGAYKKARRKSSLEERDGALANMPYNLAKASSAGMREAARVPLDVSRSVDRKATRKATRRALKAVGRALRQR